MCSGGGRLTSTSHCTIIPVHSVITVYTGVSAQTDCLTHGALAMPDERDPYADLPLLPESVPVQMPDLPPRLAITTLEQFRAVSDPVRSRILGIIQNQPATAKQIAQRL